MIGSSTANWAGSLAEEIGSKVDICRSFDALPKVSLITHNGMVGGVQAGRQVTKDIAPPDEDNFYP
ncbi:MAG: hypothetical protein IPM53_15510 [Anaerolineaceae bacterium]|nr:hypothetical protein [Anaerolineaceae bacterium]